MAFCLVPEMTTFFNADGTLASGAKLFIYDAGSAVKATTYTEADGLTANTNPIVLDALGQPAYGVYVTTGSYKLVLAPSTDTDPPTSAIRTRDNIVPRNDIAAAATDEWIVGPTPTYISGTQFSLVGDQTADFPIGTRLKLTDSGGTVYATVTVSAYTSLTTITITGDTIDSAVSAVSRGFIAATNPSLPGYLQQLVASGSTGQVPVSGGSTGVVAWAYRGMELVEYADLTNSGADDLASYDMTHTMEDGYTYFLDVKNYSDDGTINNWPAIRLRNDAGTWLTGAGNYYMAGRVSGATDFADDAETHYTPYDHTSLSGSVDVETYDFTITINNAMNTAVRTTMRAVTSRHGAAVAAVGDSACTVVTADGHDKIRIYSQAGNNMDSGEAFLYRIREPS